MKGGRGHCDRGDGILSLILTVTLILILVTTTVVSLSQL